MKLSDLPDINEIVENIEGAEYTVEKLKKVMGKYPSVYVQDVEDIDITDEAVLALIKYYEDKIKKWKSILKTKYKIEIDK